MQNFQFYVPTKVIFGQGTVDQVGQLVAEQGCKKVLVHFGGRSAKASGLLDRVCASLQSAGVPYVTLGGVKPNPRLALVYEGLELCRKEGVDFLLAVGGGSVIDSAKAIAFGLANPDLDVWDLYDQRAAATACAPVGCVLTIAAAGSETSNSSVITKETPDGDLKRAYGSDLCRPRFAIMDPTLTYTLPDYQTACGCTDIMMHTMERFFAYEKDNDVTDNIAIGILRAVKKNALILVNDPKNYNARAQTMWAGSLSHNSLTGCGIVGRGDWATHQLEHELGGMFDVAHGAGLAAMWGSWARYVCDALPARFAQFAREVMEVPATGDDMIDALAGIAAFENLMHELHMPTNLPELGVTATEQQIETLAYRCTYEHRRKIGYVKVLDESDIANIYRMANQVPDPLFT